MSDDELDSAVAPPEARRLRNDWWFLLASLDERYGSLEQQSSCLHSSIPTYLASSPARDELIASGLSERLTLVQISDDFSIALRAFEPPVSDFPEANDEPAGPGWALLLEAERVLELADWSCRSDVYGAHASDVVAAIREFGEAHAEEIAAAQSGWRELEESVADLPDYEG